MATSNDVVASRFAEQGRRQGLNIRSDGKSFYSWDAVLAQWLDPQDNLIDNSPIVILNGDQHSKTSNTHLSLVRNHVSKIIGDLPTVSFTALNAAGLSHGQGWRQGELKGGVQLVDFMSDINHYVYENDERGYYTPEHLTYDDILKNVPMGATPFDTPGYYTPASRWQVQRDSREGKSTPRDYHKAMRGYHQAGTVILRYEGFDYLCGFDEGSYFVSKLPELSTTVPKAYSILMPKEVKGKFYLRQGEWFFTEAEPKDIMKSLAPLLVGVDKPPTYRKFYDFGRREALPRTTDSSNPHVVTRLVHFGEKLFAMGTVRHSQHRMLKLNNKVYEVFKNTSLGDWSPKGRRVD